MGFEAGSKFRENQNSLVGLFEIRFSTECFSLDARVLTRHPVKQNSGSNFYFGWGGGIRSWLGVPRNAKSVHGTRRNGSRNSKPVLAGVLTRHPAKQNSDLPVELLFWLGRRDSNPRMPEPKSGALPLGDAPVSCEFFNFSIRTSECPVVTG